ncbi:hypothetical protein EMIHUDRAFT_217342 [Emiliania huxleyi CCMP1516]|uniref:Uncharacterized protein n=2 Tax=Emiliania huxleyi TaxID=2903 RepID=A0A0D3IBH3_EMIH1|nr:hypothetical protein EMIHUDRAFT_217342 [Emiliania huxleyi CCMP1516]EOD08608.1 hypothetical protein EMIHUDRAFT_217342 [Emiliania huxleyi CCMP1516]|eukprot:XP_005761037.1 hypothetical protein EMIHUDRAFT_217342 [Emiliania huxleyi CCMP1516]
METNSRLIGGRLGRSSDIAGQPTAADISLAQQMASAHVLLGPCAMWLFPCCWPQACVCTPITAVLAYWQCNTHLKTLCIRENSGTQCNAKGCLTFPSSASITHGEWSTARAGGYHTYLCPAAGAFGGDPTAGPCDSCLPSGWRAAGVALDVGAVPFAHLGGSKRRPNTVAFILTAGMQATQALERILDDVAKALERCPPVCQPQMAVTVPAGVGPGDAFVVIGPSGEQIMVSCPHESKAGEEILVMVPNASAAVAPTPAVMVTAAPIVVEGEAVTPVG